MDNLSKVLLIAAATCVAAPVHATSSIGSVAVTTQTDDAQDAANATDASTVATASSEDGTKLTKTALDQFFAASNGSVTDLNQNVDDVRTDGTLFKKSNTGSFKVDF